MKSNQNDDHHMHESAADSSENMVDDEHDHEMSSISGSDENSQNTISFDEHGMPKYSRKVPRHRNEISKCTHAKS